MDETLIQNTQASEGNTLQPIDDLEDAGDDFELLSIELLQKEGVSSSDVQKLKASGICTLKVRIFISLISD
ncbi:hypothetical protein AYI68_g5238 [Smittium mucronatum]|uniref:Uncharacterized protein n=1 Tax=Smittium mucronatum TaxID=133383 RepID=A0A1R0GUV2_9FUNG|nr:hypothetical protein AYI68_g5238 [Smittium mucronatum]